MLNHYLLNYAYGDKYIEIQNKVNSEIDYPRYKWGGPHDGVMDNDEDWSKETPRGFHGSFGYTREDFVKTDFYKHHKDFFDIETKKGGHAWFAWKPFVILDTMSKLKEKDILVYLDVGDVWFNRMHYYLDQHFANPHTFMLASDSPNEPNKKWTTSDCFKQLEWDSDEYRNTLQVEAGAIAFKVCDNAKTFLQNWLFYCLENDGAAVRDDRIENPTCGEPHDAEFKEHRHDQSILSLLMQKYNIPKVDGMYWKTQCVQCNVTI